MWFVYMTPMTQSNTSCPSLSQNQCFDFNYRDYCFRTHCAYLHQCIRCNDKHPLIRCIDTQTHTYPNFKQSFRGQGIDHPSSSPSINQGKFLHSQDMSHYSQGKWILGDTQTKILQKLGHSISYRDRKAAHSLRDGVVNGFKLRYEGPRISFFSNILVAADQYPGISQEKIAERRQNTNVIKIIMQNFEELCLEIGVPLNIEKTFASTTK